MAAISNRDVLHSHLIHFISGWFLSMFFIDGIYIASHGISWSLVTFVNFHEIPGLWHLNASKVMPE